MFKLILSPLETLKFTTTVSPLLLRMTLALAWTWSLTNISAKALVESNVVLNKIEYVQFTVLDDSHAAVIDF
jgi:hypothetical protein